MELELKPETLEKIDKLIPRYPEKRSASLPLMHLVQEDLGYIPREAVEWIAEKLEIQPINIYELLTFYPMFRDKPAGKFHIRVCRTLSCALGGAKKTADLLGELLGVEPGKVSEDGLCSIEYVECLADCGRAPVIMVNDTAYPAVSEEACREIARAVQEGTVLPQPAHPL